MEASDEEIRTAKEQLDEYVRKFRNGDALKPEEDAIEISVKDGLIWIHPSDSGEVIEIHLFDDTENQDFSPARSHIISHLINELGAPLEGKHEIHTPFVGDGRMRVRINLGYLNREE